jgi:hypothetical protein
MGDRDAARQQALRVRRWAETAGVFAQGGNAPPGLLAANTGGQPFGAGAVGTFQTKPITAVGSAASAARGPRLVLYTRRRLLKAERERLVADSGLELPVEFRVAQPFNIGGALPSALHGVALLNGRVACGSSISVGNVREAGTMGALLRGPDGALFGLSCNHVVAGCSSARSGTPIVAPGILDVAAGAPHPRTLGTQERALPFVAGDPAAIANHRDNLDAAVFRLGDPDAVTSFQGGHYDTPGEAGDLVEDDDATVRKVGRSTGLRYGNVESQLAGPVRIDFDVIIHHSADESVPFRASVFFEPVFLVRGTGGSFAANGDSGALVVIGQGADALAVGLVIGGRVGGGEAAYVIPIKPVLDGFGMTLVTRHGIG